MIGLRNYTYRASAATPRTSLLGFVLVILVGIQFISGFVVLSRIGEASEIPPWATSLHRALPVWLVFLIAAHIWRALTSSSLFGSAATKSGFSILFFFILMLGSGYTLSSSGEAGFWGAVISAFNLIYFVVWFWESVSYLLGVLGLAVLADKAAGFTAITGSTAVAHSALLGFMCCVHVICSFPFAFSIFAHLGAVHRAGSALFLSIRKAVRISWFGEVEARDLRMLFITLVAALALIAAGVWLFRLGNNTSLSTEIKPPAKVVTEVYFSGVYASFRLYSLIICIAIFVFIAVAFVFLFISRLPFIVRTLAVIGAYVFAAVLSFVGFFIENARKIEAGLLFAGLLIFLVSPAQPTASDSLGSCAVECTTELLAQRSASVNSCIRSVYMRPGAAECYMKECLNQLLDLREGKLTRPGTLSKELFRCTASECFKNEPADTGYGGPISRLPIPDDSELEELNSDSSLDSARAEFWRRYYWRKFEEGMRRGDLNNRII